VGPNIQSVEREITVNKISYIQQNNLSKMTMNKDIPRSTKTEKILCKTSASQEILQEVFQAESK
jgi:hypothetical protein